MADRPLNPFVYSRPLPPEDVVPREPELTRLVDLAEGGHNALLVAPRRFGKTSLLYQVLERADVHAGLVPIFVDLSDVLSPLDLAARIDRAYRALQGKLARSARDAMLSLGLTLPLAPFQVQAQIAGGPRPDPVEALHKLLDLPQSMLERTGRRCLVVLDEAQSLLALEGMDGLLRSHIQHQGAAASYLFSGSEPSMLRELFSNRARPLYGQAEPVRLGRLELGLSAEYVSARFMRTGKDVGEALEPLLAAAAGHPQRLMLLAHRLWDETPRRGNATAARFEAALERALEQVAPEIEQAWLSLSANERRVLAALSGGMSPYGKAAQEATALRSRSSADRAVRSLLDRAIIERAGAGLQVVDPLAPRWVARRVA